MIFYHCTSDVFLPSILKHGLGNINPNFDFKLLALLRYLYEIAKHKLSADKVDGLAFTTELMINQEIKYVNKEIYNVDVLNFKHNGTFLTPGDRAAITHSHYNKYGSEILTRVVQILNMLREQSIEVVIPTNLNLIDIESLLYLVPKPIFVKVLEIDDNYLYDQHDRPLAGTMRFVEEKLKTTSATVKFAYNNTSVFKYIKPVPIIDIEIFYLDYEGHPIEDNFEYYLTRIT